MRAWVADLSRIGLLDLTPCHARITNGLCVTSIRGTPILVEKPLVGPLGTPQSSNVYLDDSSIRFIDAVERELGGHLPRCVLEAEREQVWPWCAPFALAPVKASELTSNLSPYTSHGSTQLRTELPNKMRVLLGDLFDSLAGDQDLIWCWSIHRTDWFLPRSDYPNPVQRLGVGELGLGQILTIVDRLPAFLSDGGRGLLYLQLPDGPAVNSLGKLISVRLEPGLKQAGSRIRAPVMTSTA